MKKNWILLTLLMSFCINTISAQKSDTTFTVQVLNGQHEPLAFASVIAYQGDSALSAHFADTLGKVKVLAQQGFSIRVQIQYVGSDTSIMYSHIDSIPSQIVVFSKVERLASVKVEAVRVFVIEDGYREWTTRSCSGSWSVCKCARGALLPFSKLSTMGGMHYLDGSPTHLGNILNIPPYD